MNTRFLETFLWAARLSSFSAAAERLHTTQASVSNRIAALERELGVVLFTRDVRCVNLTPAGRLALQHAEKIVNLTGEFRQIVSNREALRGTVRIGAADTIVYAWLPLLIRRVNEQYPGVSLDLTIDTSLKLSQRIQNGEVDVGFIMGPIMAADIYNSPLCTFESCWVGAVELPLPETGVTLEDIAHFPLLTFSTGSQPHQALRALLDSHGLSDSRIYNSPAARFTRCFRIWPESTRSRCMPVPSSRRKATAFTIRRSFSARTANRSPVTVKFTCSTSIRRTASATANPIPLPVAKRS